MPKKTGANYTDRQMIKRYAANGASAEQIANVLTLPLSCVKSFMKPGATDIKIAVPDSIPKVPPMPKLET